MNKKPHTLTINRWGLVLTSTSQLKTIAGSAFTFFLQKAAFHQNMDPPDMDMQAIYDRLENIHPDNIDITSHFTAEELKDMPDIEQNRYKSIKLNYLVMLEFGKNLTNRNFKRLKSSQ